MAILVGGKRLVITGGSGFIGHHLVRAFLDQSDWTIVTIGKSFRACGDLDRLLDNGCFESDRLLHIVTDLREPLSAEARQAIDSPDYILHLAAETSVERSIREPRPFIDANVLGTQTVLDLAREVKPRGLFYFSTDEVFGPAPNSVAFREDDRHNPTNPYAATKSAAEMLCRAERHTYRIPLSITRVSNAFGERQHPEKFIPKVVSAVLQGATVPVYAYPGRQRAGSRVYTYVRDISEAYLYLLGRIEDGQEQLMGQDVHITSGWEVDNLELGLAIANILGRPLHYDLVDFHSSRPGHDLRYALDATRMARLGWTPRRTFQASLKKTVRWFCDNPRWLDWS